MLITRDGITIKVPNNFLKMDYVFGIDRFRRIKRMTGLSYRDFAAKYGFTYVQVVTWVHTKKNGEPKTPCPDCRVRLAIIEAKLRQEKKKGEQ